MARATAIDGIRTYVKTFDHSIGTNSEGKSTNKVQVHTDSNGWVRTGYPI